MTDYRLSRRAEADLGKIFDHSLQHFGLNQAKRYRASLLTCLSMLADHPRMGRLARSVGDNVRRHEHQSHVILYEERADGINVLAFVHARRINLRRLLS